MAESMDVSKRGLKIESIIQYIKDCNNPSLAVRFNESKSQYQLLKRHIQMVQVKLMLLEAVRNPQILEKDDQLKLKLKENSERNAATKLEIEEHTKSITDMAEEAQQMLEKYNSSRERYEELLSQVKAKRAEVERKEKELNQKEDGSAVSLKDHILESDEKLHTIEGQIQTFTTLQEKWKTEISTLQQEHKLLETSIATKQKIVEEKERTIKAKTKSSKVEKLREAVLVLQKLQCLRLEKVTSDQIVLRIFSPDLPCSNENERSVELTVDFKEELNGSMKICGAKVDVYSLNIEAMVADSVQTGSLLTLVQRVKILWYQFYRLLTEVETLREKYALDWLPEQGHVTVLYGEVMCCIGVTADYPAEGSVSLIKITGLRDETTDVTCLMPAEPCPTLTNWLDYLHDLVNTPPTKQ